MRTNTISEEDFENLPTPAEPRVSAATALGSHLPNPLFPSVSPWIDLHNSDTTEVAGGPIGSHLADPVPHGGSDGNGSTTKMRSGSALSKNLVKSEVKKERDRINNVTQKESAMEEAGVTRRKVYQVIADALEAEIVKVLVVNGVEVETRFPDEKRRQWGAERALQVLGDMIEHKQVEYGIADSTLERLKSLSVAELKARAAEILEGKRKAIDVATGVSSVEDAVVTAVGAPQAGGG